MIIEPDEAALGTRNRCQSKPVCGRRNRGIEVVVPAIFAQSTFADIEVVGIASSEELPYAAALRQQFL
jgi:hypothetical protein